MIAGLLRDEDRSTSRTVPGLSGIPLIRYILGNSDSRIDQTDIVMIITPQIVRGHDMTADDVRPKYVGTGQNMSTTGAPQLMSPEALGTTPPAPASAPPPAAAPIPSVAPLPEVPMPSSPAAPIVPIAPGAAAPAVPDAQARITVSAPSTDPSGSLLAGGGPYTMPIQIAGANDLATLSLTISYDPSVMKEPTVTAGSFMVQGGVQTTFVPGIDRVSGRIDLAFTRPTSGSGAAGSGLLAAISFRAGEAGTTEVRVTGVGTTSKGQSVPIQFMPARVTVR